MDDFIDRDELEHTLNDDLEFLFDLEKNCTIETPKRLMREVREQLVKELISGERDNLTKKAEEVMKLFSQMAQHTSK